MVLDEYQEEEILSPTRNGLIAKRYVWPNKTVPYVLSPDHKPEHHQMIENALKQIEAVSCIKFVRRTNENDYIQIIVSFCHRFILFACVFKAV